MFSDRGRSVAERGPLVVCGPPAERNWPVCSTVWKKKEERANSFAGVMLPLAVQAIARLFTELLLQHYLVP